MTEQITEAELLLSEALLNVAVGDDHGQGAATGGGMEVKTAPRQRRSFGEMAYKGVAVSPGGRVADDGPLAGGTPDKDNWVDKTGGLPKYIRMVANALMKERGMSKSHAISTAVNKMKKWAVTATDPKVKAAAAKAVAEWEAKKGAARAEKFAALRLAYKQHSQLDTKGYRVVRTPGVWRSPSGMGFLAPGARIAGGYRNETDESLGKTYGAKLKRRSHGAEHVSSYESGDVVLSRRGLDDYEHDVYGSLNEQQARSLAGAIGQVMQDFQARPWNADNPEEDRIPDEDTGWIDEVETPEGHRVGIDAEGQVGIIFQSEDSPAGVDEHEFSSVEAYALMRNLMGAADDLVERPSMFEEADPDEMEPDDDEDDYGEKSRISVRGYHRDGHWVPPSFRESHYARQLQGAILRAQALPENRNESIVKRKKRNEDLEYIYRRRYEGWLSQQTYQPEITDFDRLEVGKSAAPVEQKGVGRRLTHGFWRVGPDGKRIWVDGDPNNNDSDKHSTPHSHLTQSAGTAARQTQQREHAAAAGSRQIERERAERRARMDQGGGGTHLTSHAPGSGAQRQEDDLFRPLKRGDYPSEQAFQEAKRKRADAQARVIAQRGRNKSYNPDDYDEKGILRSVGQYVRGGRVVRGYRREIDESNPLQVGSQADRQMNQEAQRARARRAASVTPAAKQKAEAELQRLRHIHGGTGVGGKNRSQAQIAADLRALRDHEQGMRDSGMDPDRIPHPGETYYEMHKRLNRARRGGK